MDDNDNYKDLKKYPGVYDQFIIGDHIARVLSRTFKALKALKLNRRQRSPSTETSEPAHHRYWTQYLLLVGAIVLVVALVESILK